ncbi:hypothetical protein PCANC_01381 [Puccinia coronata f. sp. avenae]|uniref:Uncharacterized protein n=1 Tax=Puccinia coronata f. sp. avenae TaxID=200324 RepID=A0A2N5W678_9BASI|nr:hypothetical protein PCANC_01381 [Puccinia coronata f. sp. avenae]
MRQELLEALEILLACQHLIHLALAACDRLELTHLADLSNEQPSIDEFPEMRALSRPFMKFLFVGPAKTASQLTPLPEARVLHRRVRQPPRTKIRPTRPVSNGFLCPFPITRQSTVLQTQPLQRMPNQNCRRTGTVRNRKGHVV